MTKVQKKILRIAAQTVINILTALLTAMGTVSCSIS